MTLNCIIIDNNPLQRLGTLNIIKENHAFTKIIGENFLLSNQKNFYNLNM